MSGETGCTVHEGLLPLPLASLDVDGGERNLSSIADAEKPDDPDDEDGPTSGNVDSSRAIKLNAQQEQVFNAVFQALATRHLPTCRRLISVSGRAGTGKTTLYAKIVEEAERRGFSCVTAAYTAIAAQLLPGGTTCHKAFGIPIRPKENGTDRSFYEAKSPHGKVLNEADLIILDESSMLARWHIELIDHCLQVRTHSF